MKNVVKRTRISLLMIGVGINALMVNGARAATTDHIPMDVTYIDSGNPTVNYDTATTMKVKDASSVDMQVLVKYTVDLGGETLQSAILQVPVTDPAKYATNPQIYACADTSWTEGAVTWATRPAIGSLIDSKTGDFTTGPLEFDVTSQISGNGTYAFYIWSDNLSNPIWTIPSTGSQYVNLAITTTPSGPNQAPSFTSNPFSKAKAYTNVAYSGSIAADASDPEGDPMTFSLTSPQSWLSVAGNGTLTGIPGAGDTNLNAFTVQVADDQGGTNSATLNITVDAEQPTNAYNVIVLFCDDIGPQELGCYGSILHATPRLDQLAVEGMRFETCYATPICSPSRIQIMTGQHAYRTGWFDLINREYTPLPASPTRELGNLFTFGHLAQSKGYATAMAGKWQLPAGNAGQPDDLTHLAGFDTYCMWAKAKASLPLSPDPVWLNAEAARAAVIGTESSTYYRYWMPLITQDGALLPTTEHDYGPDIYSDFLCDFIATNTAQDKPFFIYYPMALIHDPWTDVPDNSTPGDPTDRLVPVGGDGSTDALKINVEYHDYIVGKIVDKVDSLGLAENTIIMYMGDNGTGNAGKGQVNEAGARVPFIVRCPGTVQAAAVSDELTSGADALLTTAHYIGEEPPVDYVSDGLNLEPILSGSIQTNRQYLFTYRGMGRMLRDSRWLYLTDRDTGEFDSFWDCGTSREYGDYVNVSGSSDSEVVVARARFEAELATRYSPEHFPGLRRADNENGNDTGDGMHDAWEIKYFGDLTTVTDPDADADLDGFSNIEEFIAGTDPSVKDSPMASSCTSVVGGDLELKWASVPYRTYSISSKEDLMTGNWDAAVSNIIATPPENSELVTPSSPTSGYYRVQVEWDGGGPN
jgi:arylsulfatase A